MVGETQRNPKQASREDVRKGTKYFAAGDYVRAAERLLAAVSGGESSPGTRLLLAESYVLSGKDEEAVEQLRLAVRPSAPVPSNFYEVLKKLLFRAPDLESSPAWKLAGSISLHGGDTHLILGGLAVELGRRELGERHLREAIRLDRRLVHAHLLLGRALEEGGQAAEAESAYREAVEVGPQSFEARFRLGEFLFAARRLQEAEGVLREAIALDADAVQGRLLLGRVVEAMGLPEKAREIFLSAVRRVPRTSEACRRLAEFCQQRGYQDFAEELLHRAILLETTTPRSYLQLADTLASRGKLREAVKCLEDADRRRPDQPEVLFKLGRLHEQADAKEAMGKTFSRFLALKKPGQKHHRFLALMALGKYEEAFGEAELILDGWDASGEYHRMFRPWADHWLKPRDDAYYLAYAQALKGEKSRPWARLYQGLFLSRLKKREEALEVLDSIGEFPARRYGWMAFAAGVERLNCGRYQEAARDFKTALASKPEAWWSRCRLAEASLCLGETEAGLAEFGRAAGATADRNVLANVWGWSGEAKLWLGRYEEALEDLNRAMSCGSWLGLCWRGAALYKLGRKDEGLADLDRALAEGSRDAEAYVWRGELKREAGRLEDSLADLDRAVEFGGGAWANVNRALTLGALGRRDGMLRDFKDIPSAMLIAGFKKLGSDFRKELSDDEAARALKALLALGAGVRRYEEYLAPLWLKGIEPRAACEAVQLDAPSKAYPDVPRRFLWRIG